MNPEFAFALLALLAVAMAAWAVVERGRAERAGAEARLLREQAAVAVEAARREAELSAHAVADTLVRRASETFAAQERQAQARLEAQLGPVAATLEKVQAHVAAAETARAHERGSLEAQIQHLLAASLATQEEARKLSGALRRGAGVQGRWGEQILRNVLETAGLQSPRDFEEQLHVQTADGAQRPDVIVRLPRGGVFVVDSKCSLTAWMEAQQAPDDAAREACYLRHAQSLRTHLQGLAAKAYWDKLELSPDFVAMFVPGDGFLAAALERAPDLMALGMERRVILVTPTTLFALCKAVAYGWRIEEQHLNARQIADLGRELYRRLSVMGEHVAGVGRALGTAVGKYNELVGSLEGSVLPQARRFEELKADHPTKRLAELETLEIAPRPLVKLASESPPPIPLQP